MNKKYLLGAIMFSIPILSSAETQNDYYVSVGSSFVDYHSVEPEGDTRSKRINIPFVLKTELHISRIDRLSAVFKQLDFTLPAGANGLGVSVDGYQISTSWERKIRWSRNIKPWFGIGIATNSLDFTDRHTTEGSGFLVDQLQDRKETSFSLLLSVAMDWELTREFFIEASAVYERPFSDGLRGAGLGVGIKYLF